MNTILLTVPVCLGLYTTQTRNPVKVRILLIVTRGSLFFWVGLTTGRVWFPTLFFLLFMGGIIIIFMILSSVLPNEKAGKLKVPTFLLLSTTLAAIILPPLKVTVLPEVVSVKSMLSQAYFTFSLTLLVTLYFFLVLFMIKTEKVPMRSVSCQRNG